MERSFVSLELASTFSAQRNTGVPVEIVEAENQADTVLQTENGAQNISAEDAMEISVEGDPQGVDSTQLSAVPRSVKLPASSVQAAASVQGAMTAINMTTSSVTPSGSVPVIVGSVGPMNMAPSTEVHPATTAQTQSLLTATNFPSTLTQSESMLTTPQNQHSSQLTRTVMEQLSDAQGLEISSDAITSISLPSANLGGGRSGGRGRYTIPQISSYSSTPNVSSLMASRGHRDLLTGNVSYSDLDLSVGANTSAIDANEPDSPSSPESNFDSSELLSNPLSHHDEVTQRLVQSGPIGIAAAAAITSSTHKRKRQHTFETNPSFRKRHCSKLTKKLKETIDELAARVGLQAVVVTYRPGKGNGKNEPSFKVFGAAPLSNIVKNQRDNIVNEMEAALHQQAPPITTPPSSTPQGEPMFELPALVFEGIPTPVHKMTQAQLRTFIPNMLKYSTGRGKPGWGKEDVRPVWWPDDVPWANVRSDIRTSVQKKALQWTDALRRIVINCYLHHGRMDLLPEFSLDLLQQYLTPQVAEQLQVQLDNLQQQQDSTVAGAGGMSDSTADEVAAALNEITEASGGVEGRDDPEMMVGDNQQVFTVDTGVGNCDMAGMPTLADASLAETAARLQQLADETGEVRYATQTVTVTERDAKALGQPVGSTTTVLLTAYPGGHSGASTSGGGESAAAGVGGGAEQQPVNPASDSTVASAVSAGATQQFLTTTQPSSTAPPGNVQVVYSASHVDPMPDSMTSNPANQDLAADFTSSAPQIALALGPAGTIAGMATSQADSAAVSMGVSDYLNPASSREVMMPHADSNVGGASESDTTNDLAAELIREYTLGADGLERKPNPLAQMAESAGANGNKSPES